MGEQFKKVHNGSTANCQTDQKFPGGLSFESDVERRNRTHCLSEHEEIINRRSFTDSLSSCEIKAWNKIQPGLNGIGTIGASRPLAKWGPGFDLHTLPAFLPSVISSFFFTLPLDPPLRTHDLCVTGVVLSTIYHLCNISNTEVRVFLQHFKTPRRKLKIRRSVFLTNFEA